MTTYVLPFPPSVNRYWRSVKGRVLISKQGRLYRGAVGIAVLSTFGKRLGSAPANVAITAWLPDARRRDADNLFKAPLDALAHAGVYDDDSQIVRLSIHKAGIDRANPRLEVEVAVA